jgi:glutathione S-transferase
MSPPSPELPPQGGYVLHGRPGWGSALVEAQLDLYGLPYRIVDAGDLFESTEARARLAPLNALAQVPTLLLPDGQVMTESAAITLHLADLAGRDDLVPGPQAPERAAFLRWLVFLVANIYPTFTYADLPERFVKTEGAAAGFRDEVDAYARRTVVPGRALLGAGRVPGGDDALAAAAGLVRRERAARRHHRPPRRRPPCDRAHDGAQLQAGRRGRMIDKDKTDTEARAWFDKLWAQGDPWDLDANPFEIAKYEAQTAVLDTDRAGRRYGRALEIGCAAGAFTRRLALRCDGVLGVDIAQPAIALARERTAAAGLANVEYRLANVMQWKDELDGQWDLVVLAETLCYLGWLYPFFDVAWFAHCLHEGTKPGGRLLLCNTCGGTEDYLLKPWIIRTYHDLFRNAGFVVLHDSVFTGNKNGADIEALVTLLHKPG